MVGFRPFLPQEFDLRAGGGRGGEWCRLRVGVAGDGFGGDAVNGAVAGYAPADALGAGVLVDVGIGLEAAVAGVEGLVWGFAFGFGFGFWEMGRGGGVPLAVNNHFLDDTMGSSKPGEAGSSRQDSRCLHSRGCSDLRKKKVNMNMNEWTSTSSNSSSSTHKRANGGGGLDNVDITKIPQRMGWD